MSNKFIQLCLTLTLITVSTKFLFGQSTWQSSIVSFGNNGKLAYVSDANQNRIIDFSYAGYKNSNEPIPVVTKIITTLSPILGSYFAIAKPK